MVTLDISQKESRHINSLASFPKKSIFLLSFKGISIFCMVKFAQKSVNIGSLSLNVFISFNTIFLTISFPNELSIILLILLFIMNSVLKHSGHICFKFIKLLSELYISI